MSTVLGSVMQDALRVKYSGAQYACGETYESLQWFDTKIAKPTLPELQAAIQDYQANINTYNYAQLRAAEYPSIQNQLLMLWSSMDAGEIPKSAAFYTAIQAINQKYPASAVTPT